MKFKSSSGQVSRVLIILAVVLLVAIVVVYLGIKLASSRGGQVSLTPTPSGTPEPPKPVYETQVGDVRFIMQSSKDLGPILKSKVTYQRDLVTTERYIQVIIAAQNKSKVNLDQFSWSVGNIIDSEGRNFVTVNNQAYYFLPKPDTCGALLKPDFQPTPCVMMYEVAKVSKGLKVQVSVKAGNGTKTQSALLDLRLPE